MGYSIRVVAKKETGKYVGRVETGAYGSGYCVHTTEEFIERGDAYQAAVKWKKEKATERKAAKAKVDAIRMHCQCCERPILAETGVIAHHGYERPDYGYQTASCYGARHLPFEVARDELGSMIEMMRNKLSNMQQYRSEFAAEKHPISLTWYTGCKPDRKFHRFDCTRSNFDTTDAIAAKRSIGIYGTFDDLLQSELDTQDRHIKNLTDHINHCQARYDGWKQTHKRSGDEWVKL